MKKLLLWTVVVVLAGGATAWLKRGDILLAIVDYQSSQEYADTAPNRELSWGQGPARASAPASERQPNIILIVADDLGFNDI